MSRGSKVGGTKRRVLDIVGFAAIVVLFLLYMVPFILVLLNSFKQKRDIIKNPFSFITEKGYTLANYTKAFEKMEFVKAFGNSLFITGLSTLLVIIFASMVAYYFTRAKNTFSRVFFALMAASMIIPFQAIMIPLVSIYGSGLHMLNHRLTLIFMHTGFAMSMSVFIYQGFIKSGIHILPFFPSSGDRGFAPMDYHKVDPAFGDWNDVEHLAEKYYLMFDYMINHISAQSPYYKDFLEKKDASEYHDLFIRYKDFWENGEPTEEQVDAIYKRKPRAPYVEAHFADGTSEKVWCTFDEEQIDINCKSETAKRFIRDNLMTLCEHGAAMIRLDAFAYAAKKPEQAAFSLSRMYGNS